MKPMWRLLTELSSRKTISKWTGAFARSSISRHLIARFVRFYSIRTDEAEKPIGEYESLNAFFVRRLKPGTRPIDPDPDALISPVDGVVTAIGKTEDGRLVNVKGQDYDVETLLNHSPRFVSYRNGYFIVLYLSPSDYHRIHVPVTGTIVETEHIAGRVYPVNRFAMRHMRAVLARNERLITYIRHNQGETALVKVGALNVSSIRYVQPEQTSVERGDELAYFEFGSTVVLLTQKDTFEPRPDLRMGETVKMGQSLGTIRAKSPGS